MAGCRGIFGNSDPAGVSSGNVIPQGTSCLNWALAERLRVWYPAHHLLNVPEKITLNGVTVGTP